MLDKTITTEIKVQSETTTDGSTRGNNEIEGEVNNEVNSKDNNENINAVEEMVTTEIKVQSCCETITNVCTVETNKVESQVNDEANSEINIENVITKEDVDTLDKMVTAVLEVQGYCETISNDCTLDTNKIESQVNNEVNSEINNEYVIFKDDVNMVDKMVTTEIAVQNCQTVTEGSILDNNKVESEINNENNSYLNNEIIITKEVVNILNESVNTEIEVQSSCDNTINEVDSKDNNEIVITMEVVNIGTDNNIKNANLNNDKIISDIAAKDLYTIEKRTPLEVIALQYDSSDSEDEKATETITTITNANDYRDKEVVLTSDDSDSSDSESDSSSSDSDSDSDSSSGPKSSNSDDSDNENQVQRRTNRTKKVFKPKGEFDDLPPIEELKISVPEVLCDPLGEVAWTVEQMVVVRPKPDKPTLNLDTVLFIDKGQRALGHIFDVFGQVTEPHYCVRFNSSNHIKESDIKVGMTVYYCPNTPYTSLVFLSELTKMKAVDDIGDDEAPQFSDDEEEQVYLASLKNKPNGYNSNKATSNETPNKRRRGNNKPIWQTNHPWNHSNEYQQAAYSYNQRPFYRTQHPWSRPRYPQPNPWQQYNPPNPILPNNHWMTPYPAYHEVQAYPEYPDPAYVQQMEMPSIQFPPVQMNPHYQLPQINAPLQGFTQAVMPPFTLPPPPPPPPPNT